MNAVMAEIVVEAVTKKLFAMMLKGYVGKTKESYWIARICKTLNANARKHRT